MKLQQTPNLNVSLNNQKQNVNNKSNNRPSFGGAEIISAGLNSIESNEAIGATLVDLISMVVPRTAIDFTRGKEAGMETARRESVSLVNDTALGLYGVGAASLLAGKFNKDYDVKAQSLFIGEDTLDVFSHIWNDTKDKEKFLHEVFGSLEGHDGAKIDVKTQKKVVDTILEGLKDQKDSKTVGLDKNVKEFLQSLILDSTHTETNFKLGKEILNAENKKVKISTSFNLKDMIDNVCKAVKIFDSPAVQKTYESGNVLNNSFISKLKGINSKTAILGLGASMIVGLGIQPLNVYLTKKKTGKSGFVGVEEKNADNSSSFKFAKYAISAATAIIALATISTKPSEIIKKIQFKSLLPSLDQFKLVYGMTIVSRMMSSRDSNELRETTFKDSLGFANWLIFGGIVSKLTALALDKTKIINDGSKFIRHEANPKAKNVFAKALDWIQNSKILSRGEVLSSALESTSKNGKALKMTELLKNAKDIPGVKRKIACIGLIQVIGYLYSGIVLGIGIPKLNIAMTKSAEKKQKALKEAQIHAQQKQQEQQEQTKVAA